MAKKRSAKAPAKKKAAAKKASPKKAAAKKTVSKKKASKPASAKKKKAAPKKPVAKKAAAPVKKKTAPKKAAKPSAQLTKKKTAAIRTPIPKAPKKENLPPATELSEEMSEKAVHEEKESQTMMGSAHGAEPLEKKEDPIMAFDMHTAQKAAARGNRNNKIRVSSTGQRSIRPSGKKPLWNK